MNLNGVDSASLCHIQEEALEEQEPTLNNVVKEQKEPHKEQKDTQDVFNDSLENNVKEDNDVMVKENTPTAEWSVSLVQPCRKVMVTPLLLLSSKEI